jgi:haloalkane dehalogenase
MSERSPLPAWLDRREFPFSPVLFEIGNDERLSVTDVGSGPPVVFSHGTPTWSYEWRNVLGPLSATHRCIAPDHLGFGLSPRPASAEYGPEAHAERFGRLIKTLRLDRYSLVVHDFGGPFALDYALEDPSRLKTLVVINSFAWPFGDSPRNARIARLAGSGLFRQLYRHMNMSFRIARSAWGDSKTLTPGTWEAYTRLFPDADSRERVLFALAKSMTGSSGFFERMWRRLNRLDETRIHLIWGMKDPAFPVTALRRFQAAWPHSTTLELETAGHWPHEEQPAAVLDSLAAVLR